VIETINVRLDENRDASFADALSPTLTGLARQSYPRELIDAIVVVGPDVPGQGMAEIQRRHPFVRFSESPAPNYFAAKNAGAQAARGSVVAMLDGDCEPDVDWLVQLVSRLRPGVAAVAGRTRYAGATLQTWTLSVPGFGYVLSDASGEASGFNINNVAFPREVIQNHPFDPRIRRNGGCVLLYHQLRAAGKEVVYEPGARTRHSSDGVRGWRFLAMHFGRGFDGVALYRLDEDDVLRGTRYFRRFGGVALLPITARRILGDWSRIVRHRRQIGVPTLAVPYFAAVALGLRLIELLGMIAAVLDPDRYSRPSDRRRRS
jgi:glycosyltransferase involved in cell wall biosynthesis